MNEHLESSSKERLRRHGFSPYVKISTTDNGTFKIVDGSEAEYKSNAKEKAEIIFRRKK